MRFFEKSYHVESDHGIGEGTSRMNTLLLNSASSSLLPWRITSSVRLLKENVTLSWAAWRIKNTSRSWPTDSERLKARFTKMTGNETTYLVNKNAMGKPAILQKTYFLRFHERRSQDSRMVLAISCCQSLTTKHGTLEKHAQTRNLR